METCKTCGEEFKDLKEHNYHIEIMTCLDLYRLSETDEERNSWLNRLIRTIELKTGIKIDLSDVRQDERNNAR